MAFAEAWENILRSRALGYNLYTVTDRIFMGWAGAISSMQDNLCLLYTSRLAPRLSFNYEWNLGLSAGWKPYDVYENPTNTIMGSKVNAYLNADFYLRWDVSPWIGLTAGLKMCIRDSAYAGEPGVLQPGRSNHVIRFG